MKELWRFILCNRSNLQEIQGINDGRGKNLDIIRNNPGSFKSSVPLDGKTAEILYSAGDLRATGRYAIKAKRLINDSYVTKWSGPITTANVDLNQGSLEIGAVGWLSTLNNREFGQDITYTSQPSASIAFAVLSHANTKDASNPTLITQGSFSGVDTNREAKFTKGQKILEAIMSLSEIESGYDVDIDPETRQLNLYAWNNYVDRTAVQCGYNWGPKNLANVTFAEDQTKLVNRLTVVGAPGTTPGFAQDLTSIATYGVFEETITLNDVKNNATLLAYAGAEVAIRSKPLLTYNIVPFPVSPNEPAAHATPLRIFEDFNLGDKIYFSARKGHVKISKQAIRVFGVSIEIDEENNEKIRSLHTSPTGT